MNRETAVYGLAKSHRAEPGEPAADAVVPYFFRGAATSLARHDQELRCPAPVGELSEEMELVVALQRSTDGPWRVAGYTFGNDLTDLAVFRADPSLIQHAKRPPASVADAWWVATSPPESIAVSVTRERRDQPDASYSARIGTAHVALSLPGLEAALAGFAGAEMFERALVYTGAPRGFTWHDSPVADGDRFTLAVDGVGLVLSNPVTLP